MQKSLKSVCSILICKPEANYYPNSDVWKQITVNFYSNTSMHKGWNDTELITQNSLTVTKLL